MNLILGENIIVPNGLMSATVSIFGASISDVDFSAYALYGENLKIQSDNDMVFYGQLSNKESTIQLNNINDNTVEFILDLSKISTDILKIPICATVVGDENFSIANRLRIKVKSESELICAGDIYSEDRLEVALILGEFYRYRDNWKFRLLGQGFQGGLQVLAEYYGVEIAAEDIRVEVERADISKTTVQQFKTLIKKLLNIDNPFNKKIYKEIDNFCEENSLDFRDLISYARRDVNKFMEFYLLSYSFTNNLKADKSHLNNLCEQFQPSKRIVTDIKKIFDRLEEAEVIRKGKLQPIPIKGIVVRNTELVFYHLEFVDIPVDADDEHVYTDSGEIFLTNERIVFKSIDYVINMPLVNLISVDLVDNFELAILSKTKKASCNIFSNYVCILHAYIELALKMYHRQADILKNTGSKRKKIPQSVKSLVWQQCGGACVECGQTHALEFDHIIPLSKGGSSTENNLQILCRECNLNKSARI